MIFNLARSWGRRLPELIAGVGTGRRSPFRRDLLSRHVLDNSAARAEPGPEKSFATRLAPAEYYRRLEV